MYHNSRSNLIARIWLVYRDFAGVAQRPKGSQCVQGKKAAKIDDPAWEVHAKALQGAS